MTLIRKVDVVWTGLGGSPYYSQFFFDHQEGKASAAATAVSTFFTANAGRIALGLVGAVQDDQTIIESSTGQPVAVEQGGSAPNITASGSSEPLPSATQGVLRLRTNVFLNGRRLQGRLFIPSPVENDSNGRPSLQYRQLWEGSGNTLRTSSVSFGAWVVFSRKNLVDGQISAVSCWEQWGVLRSRRG